MSADQGWGMRDGWLAWGRGGGPAAAARRMPACSSGREWDLLPCDDSSGRQWRGAELTNRPTDLYIAKPSIAIKQPTVILSVNSRPSPASGRRSSKRETLRSWMTNAGLCVHT
jgi:hypothetical protein